MLERHAHHGVAGKGADTTPSGVLPPPPRKRALVRQRTPSLARIQKQSLILVEAERQFARFGFEGVSLESIAAALGVSRQNMLYYYGSKEELYTAVLEDVLKNWLGSMEDIARESDPECAVSQYVHAKLQFSRARPLGSAVFTREMIAGAPIFAKALAASVLPKLRADVGAFERWAEQGKIAKVNFTHLMFVIWSATQAYADLATQFALLLDKPALDTQDFDAAHKLITNMVMASLSPYPVKKDEQDHAKSASDQNNPGGFYL